MFSSLYNGIFGELEASASVASVAVSREGGSDAESPCTVSSVIAALDDEAMPSQVGENGHPEFAWVTDNREIRHLRERFVQLFFQLVRPRRESVARMERLRGFGNKYAELERDIRALSESPEKEHLSYLLWAIPTHVRDCVKGKGERDIAYSLLTAAYEKGYLSEDSFLRVVAYWTGATASATESHLREMDDNTPPPGSWKDVVNLCHFVTTWFGGNRSHRLVPLLIRLLADQLRVDVRILETGCGSPSLGAKWAPRESSKKNRWLFYRLVRALNPEIGGPVDSPTTSPRFRGAARKTRKMLADLNRSIGTIEVRQCAGQWSMIDPSKIPAVALQKQKVALLNEIRRKMTRRTEADGTPIPRSDVADRVHCAANFREHAEAAARGDPAARVRAQRTSLYDLVRDALKGPALTTDEKNLLEAQWKDNGEHVRPGLPPMIPMVDVSGSMTVDKCTPLYYAIGLGLRVSEKTHPAFRHRILTFSGSPSWVRLPDPDVDPEAGSFIRRVHAISQSEWGSDTNFHEALRLILNRLVEASVSPEDAKELVLAIFSDMQINEAAHPRARPQAIHNEIREMYAVHGYEPPHILYWNLRTTDGFPAVTTAKNVTMLSGFSPVLLNTLENKGIAALHEYTPFRTIAELLDDPRFCVFPRATI